MDTPAASLPRTAEHRRRGAGSVALEFLGSMNLAITLLVAVAVASVIGTVLQQNQPYNDYIIKFGPFWFQVFKQLGLYDVYHAPWFLAILAFLVVSTSICIYRHAPVMLRDMHKWREDVAEKSLRAFKNRALWTVPQSRGRLAPDAREFLAAHGYAVRSRETASHTVLAAKRGTANRLGYLFTHAAIVIVCIGGLLDGNIPLMVRERAGELKVETRPITVSEMDAETFIDSGNTSFRGQVMIPEGQKANFLFLNVRDGVLVQKLPFSVEVRDFRIEHYDNGQPKSFESDLVIHDDELAEPVEATISVNHPLTHRGVTIYQASFGDGGSRLKTRAWPLVANGSLTPEVNGAVDREFELDTGAGPLAIEFTDFQLFNVHDLATEPGRTSFKNVGPSFKFKLREPDGRAREYHNYMYPVPVEGRRFMLSGMRESPAEDFRFLHIPVGPDGGLERFMRLVAFTRDEERVAEVAGQIADTALSVQREQDEPAIRDKMIDRTIELMGAFNRGGLPAVNALVVEDYPEERREGAMRAYGNILRVELGSLYAQALEAEGIDVSQGSTAEQERFFQDAVTALSALADYGAPFFLQLTAYDHVQATGLEMTRSPGKYMVYLGCGLLIAGVFMLFYVRQRRMWIYVKDAPGGAEVLFAGNDNRNSRDFAREFETTRARLDAVLRSHSEE
jgi:cytochrome c biogenesis protein